MAINEQETTTRNEQIGNARKKAAARKSGSRRAKPARRRPSGTQSGNGARGYVTTADGLMRRGKRFMDEASTWAGEAASHMPRFRGNLHMPSVRRVSALAESNPVLVGAVGLGLGVLIGAFLSAEGVQSGLHAMTPAKSRHSASRAKARTGKRKVKA